MGSCRKKNIDKRIEKDPRKLNIIIEKLIGVVGASYTHDRRL